MTAGNLGRLADGVPPRHVTIGTIAGNSEQRESRHGPEFGEDLGNPCCPPPPPVRFHSKNPVFTGFLPSPP